MSSHLLRGSFEIRDHQILIIERISSVPRYKITDRASTGKKSGPIKMSPINPRIVIERIVPLLLLCLREAKEARITPHITYKPITINQ